MQLTAERIEQLQAVLVSHEYEAVSFFPKGTASKDGYWYVTRNSIAEAGPQNKDGDTTFYHDKDADAMLEAFKDKEALAEYSIYVDGRYTGDDKLFLDWPHLARYLGITDMVVLSTKIPKGVAQKFEYYATRGDSQSGTLRQLVYDYVETQIKENAARDMFR